MSIPYVPQGTTKRFRVPRTLAADFDAFLYQDIPNTNMDFELIPNWYERGTENYVPKYIRGEIYPDSTKSRYENTDNNMNIRCSVTSGIKKGDMVVEPDGTIYILDWEVHLESNNAPSRALRCNMNLNVKRWQDAAVDEMGYVVSGSQDGYIDITAPIPCNAYRYDGRPEYVAVSNAPGTVANALTLMTVQYNSQTKNIHVSDTFDWGDETYEIVDVNLVGVNILEEYGTIKLQAKKKAGGLHGY